MGVNELPLGGARTKPYAHPLFYKQVSFTIHGWLTSLKQCKGWGNEREEAFMREWRLWYYWRFRMSGLGVPDAETQNTRLQTAHLEG